ncbi:hypothetical protein Cni_G13633 [Canna indica]|uniref:RRM domain-containing protein n=1 Tax=Canna indica TaxID=4628 RepID=A0AAQ3KCE0_9LILI|nr:hypothetical protein Cni_G13633 [Canna indica]
MEGELVSVDSPSSVSEAMTRRGKRERPEFDPFPTSLSVRLRQRLSVSRVEEETNVVRHRPSLPPLEAVESSSPSLVMVTSLPYDCTVLELKSHLEVYGPISRTRIDVDCCGFVTFRSNRAVEAAISASMDPTIGVSIRSKNVHPSLLRLSSCCGGRRQGGGWWRELEGEVGTQQKRIIFGQ